MKLLKCHINGFGNWKNKDFDFNEGLTSFCEKNGYGKSSLASFIRAMFYGLERDKKGVFTRQRALPNDGSPCGGSLDFQWRGNKYSMERSFVGKTPKDDTLTCYKNGIQTAELGEIPGITVFGLDSDSFDRTMFISSKDLQVSSSETLNGKMSHFVEGSSDGCDFPSVKNSLEELKKKYKPDRKANENGLIAEEKDKINDLEIKQSNLDNMKASMPQKYENLEKLNKEISSLQEENNKAVSHNALVKSWQTYDRESKKIEDKKNEIQQLKDKYPYGLPALEEEGAIKTLLEQKKINTNNYSNLGFSSSELDEYSYLKNRFEDGIPSKEEFNELQELTTSYNSEKNKEPLKLSSDESALIRLFDGKAVDLDRLSKQMDKYRIIKEQYDKEPDFITKPLEQKKVSMKNSIIVYLALSILFSIAGILLGIFIHPVCYFLLASWILFLFIPIIHYSKEKQKIAGLPTSEDVPNPRKNELVRPLMDLKVDLSSTFKAYGVNEDDLEGAYAVFKNKYNSYFKALEHEKEINEENEKNVVSYKDKEEQLQKIFSHYHYKGNDYTNLLMNLASDTKKYLSYEQRDKNIADQKEQLKQTLDGENQKINEFVERYNTGEITAYLSQLPIDRNSLKTKEEELQKQESDLAKFKEQERLTERPSSLEETNLQELSKSLEDAIKARQTLSSQIDEDERNISSLEDEISTLPDERDHLAKLKKDLSIISETIESLVAAENSLKKKYISPVQDQFKKYSKNLEYALGEQVDMDQDFNVSFIRDGKRSGPELLSSGEMTLCALSYRLAIIDNIFLGEEKPFLVLDDVFTDLDEEHMKMAKKFVEDLSKHEQIMYFTCHPSRDIE